MSMDELDGGAAWSRKQDTAEPSELELLALRRVEASVVDTRRLRAHVHVAACCDPCPPNMFLVGIRRTRDF